MTFQQYKFLVRSDLYRYDGKQGIKEFCKQLLSSPGFVITFWMRTGEYCHDKPLLRYSVYPLVKFIYRRASFQYGISIPIGTEIGPGFYIGHHGGIVVNGDVKIGANCNISQGVTIGQSNRGRRAGTPVIGNNVYLGPGSKIIGKIVLGDGVVVGANAVVVTDMADNTVCAGIPGEEKSLKGSAGYIQNVLSVKETDN